jgi:hypothetical protein
MSIAGDGVPRDLEVGKRYLTGIQAQLSWQLPSTQSCP